MKKPFLFIALIVAFVAVSCSKDKATNPPGPTSHLVKYEVNGSAGVCSITYYNITGDVDILAHQPIPWSIEINKNSGDEVGICAFGENDGTVNISLYADNALMHRQSTNVREFIICVDDTL